MPVRVNVSPELLEWAVHRSRIDADALADRLPMFELWLSGASSPTLKQLESFARRTHTPLGYLFLEGPPVEALPIPDFRTVADESIEHPSADLLDTVYVCQARQEWYRDNQLRGGEAPVQFLSSMTVQTPTEDAARDLRDRLDWTSDLRGQLRSWSEALSRLRERAEALGLLVMISGIVGSNTRRKLDPSEFRGFALADPYAPVAFVNGADSKAAQVFTLAHELAHLWLGATGLDDLEPRSEQTYEQERWCSQVAAELLVPMDEFRAVFDASAELRAQLQPLAERFRVSTQVIIGRVREAGHLTWERFLHELRVERERISGIITERGTGGNFYYTKPVQVSRRFAREVVASTLEGWTPYTEAFRLLNVRSLSTFEGLAEQLGVA
jgi:Zn-dependent peptidase ImmA (M78 family)